MAKYVCSVDNSTTMPEDAVTLLDRLDRRLAEMDKSRYWLAKEASEGRNTGFITDIDRKGYIPKEPRLRRMAELLGVSVDWLMGRTDVPGQVQSEVGVSDRGLDLNGLPPDMPGIPLVGTGDCADLEVCDESGRMVTVERSSFDSDYHVRIIQRPPALRGARDLYAIYFHGESMTPRFEPGEIGIVDPGRHARPGDYVLVQINSGESDEVVSVLVKRLVRATNRELTLEQFNPPLVFTVPRDRVARYHRIVPQTELLG